MADRTAAINHKYQMGLKQVDKAINNMVVSEHGDTSTKVFMTNYLTYIR